MSILTYNGIQLPYASTTRFTQEAVYDDLGGTDWYLTRYDISVQSVLNTDYLSSVAPALVGNTNAINAASVMTAIRTTLLQPRKALSMKFNGIELIPEPQLLQVGTVDAQNGPKPQSCTITQLNNATFLITYHIIANYWENLVLDSDGNLILPTENAPGNNVLFNRWSERVEIDRYNYSKRIRDGKFIIRSDNVSGNIADLVRRQFAIVGIPRDFIRESSTYTVTADGLAVQYTIVDRELFKMPPAPAFEADGEYIESLTDYGSKRIGEVRVRLKGSKETPEINLVQTCISVATSKISISGVNTGTELTVPLSGSLMVKLYDNEVECRIRAMMKPRTGNQPNSQAPPSNTTQNTFLNTWGWDINNFVITPLSEQGVVLGRGVNQPNYTDRGSASLLLQAAAYFDPSLQATLDPVGGQMTQGLPPGVAGAQLETQDPNQDYIGSASAFEDNGLTPIQNNAAATILQGQLTKPVLQDAKYQDLSTPIDLFVDYMIQSRYEKDKHIYMMPTTVPATNVNSPIPTSAFVQLAAPTLLWIVDWTASKVSFVPEYPSPKSASDPTWVLLDEHYEPAMLIMAPDGDTPIYRISGTYVFGLPAPADDTTLDIFFSKPAWMDPMDSFSRFITSASEATDGLLDQNTGGG